MTQKTLTKADLSQFTGTEQWYRHGLARNVLYPVAAAGSMSLSAYSLHIVIVAFHTDWVGGARWTPLLGLIGITLLCSTAWKHFFTRGPLEWIMWKVSLKAAS